jgi:hypothetical protein
MEKANKRKTKMSPAQAYAIALESNDGRISSTVKNAIASSACYSCMYAENILRKPWPKGERAIYCWRKNNRQKCGVCVPVCH